ncbi:lysophospholipid acyltransferase 2-like isoform X1 [Ptychodera flava]|uniref:lysophospholipid acyltransferase 2-like isoform X1 n=1 Tax=Ptychodera flava TaxID=63121 RepID=UPI003969E9BB
MVPSLWYVILQLSELLGLPVDKATVPVILVLAIVLAIPYRIFLHPSRADATTKHIVAIGIGFYFSYYLHSWGVVILLVKAVLCYILMVYLNPTYMPKVVFAVAMGILTVVNFREFLHDSPGNNVVRALMIFTAKITSLAWSIHDGFARDRAKLSDFRSKKVVRRIPSVLEYTSYLFHFQALAVGPFCFYKDYIDFIEGRHVVPYKIIKDGKEVVIHKEPPVTSNVLRKTALAIILAAVNITMTSRIPLEDNIGKPVLASAFVYRVLYAWSCVWLVFLPLYAVVWILGDVACNISGFGFNGYDSNGEPKWDLVSNIHIKPAYLCSNMKESIDCWHISINNWLRYVSYERLRRHNLILTYLLSMIWHGFLPGYIWFCVSCLTLAIAQKRGRRVIRPYFTTSKQRKLFYDFITWFGHWLVLPCYLVMFLLRNNARIVMFGRANYFWGHFVTVILLILVYCMKPPKKLEDHVDTHESRSLSNKPGPMAKNCDKQD